MSREIIVVTSAYGYEAITVAGGQQAFCKLIREAGADGVEIRRELLNEVQRQALPALGKQLNQLELVTYYSVPAPLFSKPGQLNPDLEKFQQEAMNLQARAIKFSLGAGPGNLQPSDLSAALTVIPIPVLVENDQTHAGTLPSQRAFFQRYAGINGLAGMTFDTGNWLWVHQSPEQAATQLTDYVRYIHLKATEVYQASFRAVAPNPADNQWRVLLQQLPSSVPLGIEFPLEGEDLLTVTRQYIRLLREI